MAMYNHIGLVVTDLNRSKRFYQEVFGFEPWYEIQPHDAATAKLCRLTPPIGMTASYLVLEGLVLELIHYAEPGVTTPFTERGMNEPGLTHLSMSVEGVRGVAERAVEFGGQIVEASDVGVALFVRDPDGQLIELLPASYRESLPPKP
jgi:lactoylglutathione lyase